MFPPHASFFLAEDLVEPHERVAAALTPVETAVVVAVVIRSRRTVTFAVVEADVSENRAATAKSAAEVELPVVGCHCGPPSL